MENDLAVLKHICSRILDRHAANEYPLPSETFYGLTFEEVLTLIVDDFIPAAKVAA